MLSFKERIGLLRAFAKNPQLLRVSPAILLFLARYLGLFRIACVGKNYIIHSHLPPLNSKAYSRFIDEQLVARSPGPSHAQVAVTQACPQNCAYCYNKKRKGIPMDTATIIRNIQELKNMGIVWLGLTGGEPLLNKDLPAIIESAAESCAVKLFTTGSTLTRAKALDLQHAGLFSVSVSLDSSRAEDHDRIRNYKGAFEIALKAIDIFKSLGTVHVGVSAVLSRQMINNGEVEPFLAFLAGLGIHEAWLSEIKPSTELFWKSTEVIRPDEQQKLIDLQDRYNRQAKMTVNYLGHFESRTNFGCNAGHKMVYIDPFGGVSPCVFIPMTFGNVKDTGIREIWDTMSSHFPSESECFINKNYSIFKTHAASGVPFDLKNSSALLEEITFGPLAVFNRLHTKGGTK